MCRIEVVSPPCACSKAKFIARSKSMAILFSMVCLVLSVAPLACAQTLLDEIGYTQLQNEVGFSLANGSTVNAALIEAGTNYLPDLGNAALSGKSISNISGSSNGISGHSTGSAVRLFGTSGVSPGLDNVDVYNAEDWINNHIGGLGSADPVAQGYDVTSHSYILPNPNNNSSEPNEIVSGEVTVAAVTEFLRRVDFVNARDNTLTFAGSSNGFSNTLPYALTPGYNVVGVGRSDGNHGFGVTTFYGAGRTKVEIVVPEGVTSSATPVAAAAGSLLIDSAGVGTEGARNQVVKATLLAGATKEEFATWDRTTTRPLDERFGAGELNIYNSYQIQQAGQQEGANVQGGSFVSSNGWDYVDSFNPINDRFYTFQVDQGQTLESLSIILNWNLNVTDTGLGESVFAPVTSLTNFNLELLDVSGSPIDASESTVDNVEHIFVDSLSPGVYHLRVSGDSNDSYGLAWRSSRLGVSAIPEPGGAALFVLVTAAASLCRRRKI